jgi:hypothetical protein
MEWQQPQTVVDKQGDLSAHVGCRDLIKLTGIQKASGLTSWAVLF